MPLELQKKLQTLQQSHSKNTHLKEKKTGRLWSQVETMRRLKKK